MKPYFSFTTLRASEALAQCIVIGPVCGFVCVCEGGFVCVCGGVCYHDNSKLRASILTILTKLGLEVKV